MQSDAVPKQLTEQAQPMHERDMAALAGIDILKGLDRKTLEEVAETVHFRNFDAHQEVVTHQDTTQDVFIILEGQLRVTIFSKSGKEIAFRDLGPGESFGELSAIDGAPRSASVVTLKKARVGTIARQAFLHVATHNPIVANTVLCKLTFLVRSLSERVFEFSTPVPTRVCIELLRVARQNMLNPNTARITPAPKHAEIASRINTHREAVSRVMSDLQKRGLLRRGQGELLVLDVQALADEIEGDDGEEKH